MDAVTLLGLAFAASLLFGLLVWSKMQKQPFLPTLKDKHVVITGGSTGIGLSLGKVCLMEGAHVTLMSRTEKNLVSARDALLQEVGCSIDSIFIKAVDVSCASEVREAIHECSKWRPIDVLVCNAGIAVSGYLDQTSPKDLYDQMRVNYLGSIYPIHAALPLLKQRAVQGLPTSIVFMNSLCSLYFACGGNAYMVAKCAQKGLAELLRVQLLPYNIKVQLVIPGFTDTAMLEAVEKFAEEAPIWGKLFLFKREKAQTPDDVARKTLKAMKEGHFLTTTAFDGFFLGILGRRFAPEERPLYALLELILLLPARIASFLMFFIICATVKTQSSSSF